MKMKCKICGSVVKSMYRHDFVTCKCGKVSIDGGSDYTRCVGNPDDYELIGEK